jgi:hypothetical protein
VQPWPGEQVGERAEHRREERARRRQPRHEDVVDEVLHARRATRIGGVAELGHRRQRGEAMAGQVDLGDDLDAQRPGPRHPPVDVAGRVRASVGLGARPEQRGDGEAVPPPCPDLGERGVTADREPPPLVVGEVQVNPVEPAPRGAVDEPADVDGGDELAGQIDVEPAPPVHRHMDARRVRDVAPRPGEREKRRHQRLLGAGRNVRAVDRERVGRSPGVDRRGHRVSPGLPEHRGAEQPPLTLGRDRPRRPDDVSVRGQPERW